MLLWHAAAAAAGAPGPKRDFIIARVHPSTQDSTFRDFLSDNGFANFEFKLVSRTVAPFKSYKLTVFLSEKEKLLQPNLWPKGILVQKWKSKSGNNNNYCRERSERPTLRCHSFSFSVSYPMVLVPHVYNSRRMRFGGVRAVFCHLSPPRRLGISKN